MRQNGVNDASSLPTLPLTYPCENELFAAEGRIVARGGSHNVKICAVNFTFQERSYPATYNAAREKRQHTHDDKTLWAGYIYRKLVAAKPSSAH